MSFRFMRVVVFFDLPVETSENRRDYNRFHKYLLKNGFIMMQESVYSKLAINKISADLITEGVRKNKPPEGIIQVLTITEKQYAGIEYIIGSKQTEIIDSDERYVEI